jgi:hypothetical protein
MSRKPFGKMADAFVNGHFGTSHIRGWIYTYLNIYSDGARSLW